MKLLFDIFTSRSERDVIRHHQYKDYIAHYHTAGVPGGELDDTRSSITRIMRAILATGYRAMSPRIHSHLAG